MANLKLVRAHGGSNLEEGKERMERLMLSMEQKLDKHLDRIDWNSERTEAKVKGRHVKGLFWVDATNFNVDLTLSMTASRIRGLIEARVDQALREAEE